MVGTPQFMAPELFEGKPADARSDIWAFGAVLYEMATGKKAFEGSSYSSLVGAILAAEPKPMEPLTPAWLERLVRRCLAKDPTRRYQHMGDVVLDLQEPPTEAENSTAAQLAAVGGRGDLPCGGGDGMGPLARQSGCAGDGIDSGN